MDADHVDALSRALSTVGSRRRTLGGFGAAALALMAGDAGRARRLAQSPSPPVEPGRYEEPYVAPGQYAPLASAPPARPITEPSLVDWVKAAGRKAAETIHDAIPDVDLPEVTLPEVTLPEVTLPEVTLPEVNITNPFGHEARPAEVAPTCSDGIRNGRESDVDCGGPECRRCATNQACAGQADCRTALCINTVCRACQTHAWCGGDRNGACRCIDGVCVTKTSSTSAAMCADCPPAWYCTAEADTVVCFAPCGSA